MEVVLSCEDSSYEREGGVQCQGYRWHLEKLFSALPFTDN